MRISDWSSDVCSSDLHALVDYLVADAGRPEDAARTVEAVVARHGRLDVLVNNAGAATVMPLQQASYEKVMAILAVNEIGRAACRERGCQDVSISVVAVELKKKTKKRDE